MGRRHARLAPTGLVDVGGATEVGRRLRDEVEATTDRLALAPWRALGEERSERLRAALMTLSGQVVAAGVVPVPNPIGAPWP